jgi:hypothetical protein
MVKRSPTKTKTPSYGLVFVGCIWKQILRAKALTHVVGFLLLNYKKNIFPMKKIIIIVSILSVLIIPINAFAASGTVMLPDGCTTSTKFSATTGQSCAYVMVADCNAGDSFSQLTGKECPGKQIQDYVSTQARLAPINACIAATNAKAIADSNNTNTSSLSYDDQYKAVEADIAANTAYNNACFPGDAESLTPTAVCNDFTPSYSINHSGSCSSHGGVLVFLQ